MTTPTRKLLLLSLLLSLGHAAAATPMRYHGQLSDGGQPANGRYDLQISLYSSADAGGLLGFPTTLENVEVVNGQFQVELEAPAAAQNGAAWLQAAVRDGASNGAFNEIAGREKVTLAPLIGACWSTTGDSGTNPLVNYHVARSCSAWPSFTSCATTSPAPSRCSNRWLRSARS